MTAAGVPVATVIGGGARIDHGDVALPDAGMTQLEPTELVVAIDVDASVVQHELRLRPPQHLGQRRAQRAQVGRVVRAGRQVDVEVGGALAEGGSSCRSASKT